MATNAGDAAEAAARLKKALEKERSMALQAGQGSRDEGQKKKTKTGLEPG